MQKCLEREMDQDLAFAFFEELEKGYHPICIDEGGKILCTRQGEGVLWNATSCWRRFP
jgi:hypothetical protein